MSEIRSVEQIQEAAREAVADGVARAEAGGGYAEVTLPPGPYWGGAGEAPRGFRVAVAWIEQIRAATGAEPDSATIERIIADCFRNRRCRDCAAKIGEPHDHGCDVERCQYTGLQWIGCGGYTDEHGSPFCDCADDENYDADGYTIHTCGQAPHDCGSEVWDGVWPGYPEAIGYGWFTWFAPPWRDCGPEHPQAVPNLTRLRLECDWDREAKRWVRREPAALDPLPGTALIIIPSGWSPR